MEKNSENTHQNKQSHQKKEARLQGRTHSLEGYIESGEQDLQALAKVNPFAQGVLMRKQKAAEEQASQLKTAENKTGLPDNLKTNMEHMSGISLDDVKVYRNSDKPAQLQAHAYAQGSDIHLASGQEKHLAHEAWHVVQQKQGRVQPTTQLKGTNVNDDSSLEKEADQMGAQAQSMPLSDALIQRRQARHSYGTVQRQIKSQDDIQKEYLARLGKENAGREDGVDSATTMRGRLYRAMYEAYKKELGEEKAKKKAQEEFPALMWTHTTTPHYDNTWEDRETAKAYIKSKTKDIIGVNDSVVEQIADAIFTNDDANVLPYFYDAFSSLQDEYKAYKQKDASASSPEKGKLMDSMNKLKQGKDALYEKGSTKGYFRSYGSDGQTPLFQDKDGRKISFGDAQAFEAYKKMYNKGTEEVEGLEGLEKDEDGKTIIFKYTDMHDVVTYGVAYNAYTQLKMLKKRLAEGPIDKFNPKYPELLEGIHGHGTTTKHDQDGTTDDIDAHTGDISALLGSMRLQHGNKHHTQEVLDNCRLIIDKMRGKYINGWHILSHPGTPENKKAKPDGTLDFYDYPALTIDVADIMASLPDYCNAFVHCFNEQPGQKIQVYNRGSFGFLHPTVAKLVSGIRIWPGQMDPDIFVHRATNALIKCSQILPGKSDNSKIDPKKSTELTASTLKDVSKKQPTLLLKTLDRTLLYVQEVYKEKDNMNKTPKALWLHARIRESLVKAQILRAKAPQDKNAQKLQNDYDLYYIEIADVIEDLNEYAFLLSEEIKEDKTKDEAYKNKENYKNFYPQEIGNGLKLVSHKLCHSGIQAANLAKAVKLKEEDDFVKGIATPAYFELRALSKSSPEYAPDNNFDAAFHFASPLAVRSFSGANKQEPALQQNNEKIAIIDMTNISIAEMADLVRKMNAPRVFVHASLTKHFQLGRDAFTLGVLLEYAKDGVESQIHEPHVPAELGRYYTMMLRAQGNGQEKDIWK